jgi:hypothetical protein
VDALVAAKKWSPRHIEVLEEGLIAVLPIGEVWNDFPLIANESLLVIYSSGQARVLVA